MKQFPLFAVAVLVPLFAVAAPVPKPTAKPITPANADLVRSVAAVERRAYKLLAGPGRGELIAFDYLGPAEVLDERTLKPLRAITGKTALQDFAISSGGAHTAWMGKQGTGYTLATGGQSFPIEIGQHPGNAAFSPDGKTLAIGHSVWNQNAPNGGHSEVLLFDLKGKLVRTLEKSGAGGITPLFSPDGKTLAVGNRNHQTRLFDVATGKLLHTLDKAQTQGIAFRPDGKVLAVAYCDGTVGLWDVATGKLRRSAKSGCEELYSVAWNPTGDLLATAGHNGTVVLWEPEKLIKLKELDAGSWVIQVRFTADGSRLLTASGTDYGRTDRKIEAWGVTAR